MAPRKNGKPAGPAKKSAGKKSPSRGRGAPPGRVPARPTPGMRVSLWCAAVFSALFILALAAALLVFSPYRRIGMPRPGERHFQTLNRVTSRASAQTFRRDPPAEARLRLSPEEVNDLLELGQASAGFTEGMPPAWSFSIVYRPDGSFDFTLPLDAAPEWLFGGKIYLRGTFRLEKQDEKLLLEVPKLRVGRAGFSVPGGGMFAGRECESALREALTPEFDAAVKEFYPESDGSLVLVYRPAKLLPLLLKFTR